MAIVIVVAAWVSGHCEAMLSTLVDQWSMSNFYSQSELVEISVLSCWGWRRSRDVIASPGKRLLTWLWTEIELVLNQFSLEIVWFIFYRGTYMIPSWLWKLRMAYCLICLVFFLLLLVLLPMKYHCLSISCSRWCWTTLWVEDLLFVTVSVEILTRAPCVAQHVP